MAITLKDVAREVGVSAHSVSAVLNGKAEQYRISQATQKRIKKMAQEMGYDPDNNRSARQMAARKHGIRMLNNVIAVCSNPSDSPVHRQPFESDILDGIESVADEQGMDVLMCRLRPGKRLPRLLERGEVDGIITVSSRSRLLNMLHELHLPIVHLGSKHPRVCSVSADHWLGISLTTRHLIQLGHRQIAYIGYDINRSPTMSVLLDAAKKRFGAFINEMNIQNIVPYFVDNTLDKSLPEYGMHAFTQLWQKSQGKITAVVCYNDTLAMGTIEAAQKLGLSIPRDLSVTGFDAVSDKFHFTPLITSIGYDRQLMGKRAVEILMQCRLGGERQREYIQEELPVHFVEGETTAPPRKTDC